ncbi:ABC transporter ATP-binding protein [Enterobacteriaceae bacterium 4M9]|nr:ABC transporter ATP-binding protein [Enterobacteriaceae bacterium 4M9]
MIAASRASGEMGGGQEDVMVLLEQPDIAHLTMRWLDTLCGGQKQLVGLVQSLIRRPSLLLPDEPPSVLDLNYRLHVMALVEQETRRRNIVTVMVVHDLNIALHHVQYVLMLKQGRLVASGAPGVVITPENLAEVDGLRGRIERCSQDTAQILIDGLVHKPAG